MEGKNAHLRQYLSFTAVHYHWRHIITEGTIHVCRVSAMVNLIINVLN